MIIISRLLILLAPLILISCNGIAIQYSVPAQSEYEFDRVVNASRSGEIYADVVQSLDNTTSKNFRQTVRRLMSDTINGVPLKFVGKSVSGISHEFRVVVWFKPSQNPKYINLCTYMGGVAIYSDPQAAEVAMALCDGDKLLTSASGIFYFFDVDPLKTNRFRILIKEVTASLFPKSVPTEDEQFERWL